VAVLALLVLPAAGAAASPAAGTASNKTPYKRYVQAVLLLKHPRGLQRFVRRVSDPRSPRYRHYLSVERMIRRFGGRKKARRRTLAWLERNGARGTTDRTGTVAFARLLEARAARLLAGGASVSAVTEEPGAELALPVPAALRGSVDALSLVSTAPAVAGQVSRPDFDLSEYEAAKASGKIGSLRDRTGTPKGCEAGRNAGPAPQVAGFTPNQYLRAYGHSILHRRGLKGQGMRAAVVETDGFLRSDIETFGSCFAIRIPPTPIFKVGIKRPLPPGDETTLDLEVLSAAAPRLRSIDVYEGGDSTAALLRTTAGALGPRGRHPDVISLSLGECEAALTGGTVQARAINRVFAIAAGAGISVFAAAGDTGSAGCRVDLAGGTTALPLTAVSFPASSPFVTAVGGTNISLDPANRLTQQVTWNDVPLTLAGGGGETSIVFKRPTYQRGRRQRGATRIVPDISALADIVPGYAIYCTNAECGSPANGWLQVGGTSAATPLMAGGVLLATQRARRRGQPPLGLINPLVYRLGRGRGRAKALSDVRIGDNDVGLLVPADAGGGAPLGCCRARRGYDHATGWGSLKLPGFARRALRAGR
jgi:subtilase family serine protease